MSFFTATVLVWDWVAWSSDVLEEHTDVALVGWAGRMCAYHLLPQLKVADQSSITVIDSSFLSFRQLHIYLPHIRDCTAQVVCWRRVHKVGSAQVCCMLCVLAIDMAPAVSD